MDDLIKCFEKTIEDKKLSSSERKALSQLITEYQLNNRKQGILRNKIFDLAREKTYGHENRMIIDWLENANKIIINEYNQIYNEVFFSPGTECLDAIIDQLKITVSTVDICVFTISDDRITKEILETFRRGVKIRIITDDEKTKDEGSDIMELSRKGIPVKIDTSKQHMHHKFAVLDQTRILTGSFNWTRTASENNYENILISNDEKIVNKFSDEFNNLWDLMIKY